MAYVIASRIFELILSNKNTKRLINEGGKEYYKSHYKFIVVFHFFFVLFFLVKSFTVTNINLLYLSEDYAALDEWKNAFNNRLKIIDTGPTLDDTANFLRKPFINLISDLGDQYSSLAWWTSRVSERHTMVSPLFLHCCYYSLAIRTLKTNKSMIIVADSWAVLESIEERLILLNNTYSWVQNPPPSYNLMLQTFIKIINNIF